MIRVYDRRLLLFFFQDLFLERLYQQLDDTGLSENTYVVVVGDHGEVRENKKYQTYLKKQMKNPRRQQNKNIDGTHSRSPTLSFLFFS